MLDLFLIFLILTVTAVSAYVAKFFFVLRFHRIRKIHRKNVKVTPISYLPKISVVLPVYNEERIIEAKIQNLLELDYPADRMEIIVVDGCSTDRTAELVKAFRNERIKLIQQKDREGVTEAVKVGVLQSEGEIIVMTDAEAAFEPNALRFLLDDFTNPEVGAVTGTEVVVNPSKNIFTRMESTYRKFFNISCIAESNAYSTSCFRGEFAGLRKELFPMTVSSREGILDVEIALGVIRKGYRAICDERIKFFGLATSTLKDRNRQKIQRATLIQETIIRNIDFLFKPKYKTFGLIVFPCNFIMYFISPIIFLTLLGLYPLIIINCILHSQVLTLILIIPALFMIFSKKYRIFILAFLHAQYSLTVGMFRIALLGRPDYLSQVKSTRKGFVSPIRNSTSRADTN